LTARVFSLEPLDGFIPTTLGGHKDSVVGTYFSSDQETIYTVSRDGAVFSWRYEGPPKAEDEIDDLPEEENESQMRWRIVKKNFFLQNNAKVRCAAYHAQSDLLVVGFSSGIFGLYEMPDFNMIHTLR